MTFKLNMEQQNVENALNSLLTDINAIKTFLQSKGVMSAPGLAQGALKKGPSNVDTFYVVGGVFHFKAAVGNGTPLSGPNLPNGAKYGAWALDIDSAGTLSIAVADNAVGYATSALALAGLAALAAGKVRLGTVTVKNDSAGNFVPGTTDLDAVGLTVVYTDSTSFFNSLPASVSEAGT